MDQIKDSLQIDFVRKIAEGGMGSIYEGQQLGTDGFLKQMAVKMLNLDVSSDQEFVEMFIGEAKLVANLVHQNIVQIYHLGRYEGNLYIAMEYLNGINLQEFFDRHKRLGRKIPYDLVAFIISRVCRALEYAHEKRDEVGRLLRVVHRDVSPKNIMCNFEGVVKLTDFGIAKAQTYMGNREGDILLGKTQYMSPEQAAFQETDGRSDLFSLGIVMFECLTGSALFADDDTIVVLDKVMNQEIPDIHTVDPDVPQKLIDILGKSLKRELGERYQAARDMGDDLEHFLYDDGYGPTNQTLEKYLKELFPELISE
ncbi:MAG: serine/threonine-protein kinase [Planctomycetota bacterium]|jgi:serine/threonine-protein kinase|nr:serine/threonine-protein kinase [Planctomycetota bacterium]